MPTLKLLGQEELLALQAALWPSLGGDQPLRALIEQERVREEDLDFRRSDPKAVVLSFIRLGDAVFAATTLEGELSELSEHLVEAKKKFESSHQRQMVQETSPPSPSQPGGALTAGFSPSGESMHPVTPSVPTPASRVVQTRVIERLLQKGREYNDKLRRLQEEEEAKVREESPFQPKILDKSRSLASGKKGASVFKELFEHASARDQRLRDKQDGKVHSDLSMAGDTVSHTATALLALSPEGERKAEQRAGAGNDHQGSNGGSEVREDKDKSCPQAALRRSSTGQGACLASSRRSFQA